MPTSPVIEWRVATTPFAVLTSSAITGSGSGGSIPVGSTSNTLVVRLYNNFAAASGIADALSCVLAVYDDTVHSGVATQASSTGLYVQVEVIDYNGVTTGQDTLYVGIGGSTKHAIPVNTGTIGGTGANYVTINIQVVVPSTSTQGAVSQGIWVEYNSTA